MIFSIRSSGLKKKNIGMICSLSKFIALCSNMSKKIRLYEKERGGVDAFLSPRVNLTRKNVVSPTGNRVFNQSAIGSQGTLIEPKQYKNYYG